MPLGVNWFYLIRWLYPFLWFDLYCGSLKYQLNLSHNFLLMNIYIYNILQYILHILFFSASQLYNDKEKIGKEMNKESSNIAMGFLEWSLLILLDLHSNKSLGNFYYYKKTTYSLANDYWLLRIDDEPENSKSNSNDTWKQIMYNVIPLKIESLNDTLQFIAFSIQLKGSIIYYHAYIVLCTLWIVHIFPC